MSGLNTFFNGASALSNSRTAHAAAATSLTSAQLAAADRHRELRERGLITNRSTPGQIAAVEELLACQMRARMELNGESAERHPYREVVAIALISGFVAIAPLSGTKPALAAVTITIWAVLVAVYARRVQRREEEHSHVIARADWDENGECGWCGRTEPHLVEGAEEHPRVAHAVEVEQELRA